MIDSTPISAAASTISGNGQSRPEAGDVEGVQEALHPVLMLNGDLYGRPAEADEPGLSQSSSAARQLSDCGAAWFFFVRGP